MYCSTYTAVASGYPKRTLEVWGICEGFGGPICIGLYIIGFRDYIRLDIWLDRIV